MWAGIFRRILDTVRRFFDSLGPLTGSWHCELHDVIALKEVGRVTDPSL